MYLPIIIFAGIGFIAAVILGIAAKVFYVEEDPKIKGVLNLLPGANCGGCGYAGCSACAEAMVNGEAQANACVVGQTEVANDVAGYLGMEVMDAEPQIATPECSGGIRSIKKFNYQGFDDCRAAILFYQGAISCENGCLGLGTCVKACKFNAITMGDDDLPHFDPARCVGCGECTRACPKGIIDLISEKSKILQWNKYTECLAPCRQKCPAQIDISRYIRFIKAGKYKEAFLTIKEHNPLPLTCGRVCPEPCNLACRRTINDEPVGINYLKRFVADYEMNSGERYYIPVASPPGPHTAVPRSGPAVLSAAYYLKRLGHDVTIYEKQPEMGGMLRYGIPEYRLPKNILDWDIQGIIDLGITVRTNVEIGKDFTIEFLRAAGFDAIFLAIGAWSEHALGIEGCEVEGVTSGITFLEQYHLEEKKENLKVGEKVFVVGGGNTAMDAARSALRLGAKEVRVIYRRSRDEMPANPIEIVDAEEEGIIFNYLNSPNRIISENGKVTGLEVTKMELGEPDPSGRRRPVPVEGSEEIIPGDMIIQAIGQFPDITFMEKDETLKLLQLTRWKTVEGSEETLQTDVPYIFTGGDCFTGPGLAVEAIASGRFAARSIHYYVMEGEIPPVKDRQREMISESIYESLAGVKKMQRVEHGASVPLEDRLGTFKEVEATITEEEAMYEANRCLDCGIYCYNREVVEKEEQEAKK